MPRPIGFWGISPPADLGLLMVSSTERIMQQASQAAVRALILITDGSQTKASKLSAMCSFKMSTPNHWHPVGRDKSDVLILYNKIIVKQTWVVYTVGRRHSSYSKQNLTLCMLLSQFVQDVGCIETGIIAKLARDDLKCLGECSDEQLLLTGDCARIIT